MTVVIYSKNNCVWCTRAKKLAEDMHLDFEVRNVEENIDYGFSLMELMDNQAKFTFPQIWWHGNHIGGYTEFAQEVENTIGSYGHEKI